MQRKIKVLLVGPVPPPYGGIPKYVSDLYYSSYLRRNYDIVLFNTAIPARIRRFEKRNERSYLSFLSDGIIPGLHLFIYVLTTFYQSAKAIINESPYVVQVFTSSYWGFWRSCIYILIAKCFKIKVIFHLLNAIDIFWNESSKPSRALMSYFMNKTDVLLVQSKGIKKFVEGISRAPVKAIYNGVNIELYNNEIRNRINHKFEIVFVGALLKAKGVLDLLRACAFLKKESLQIKFIGRGDIDEYNSFIKKNGISDMVKFIGQAGDEEKISLLKNAQVFVLPSYAEGQPLSILEAMSCGLPIISTRVGTIPELIKDEENGFLVTPGDYKSLADKINLLFNDRKLYCKISENNYKTARSLYDIHRLFEEMAEVYTKLL